MLDVNFLNQGIFQAIIPAIDSICKANKVDDTHGLAHAIKIATQTDKALQSEIIDRVTYQDLIYAALLHDIDDYKYFKTKDCSNAVSVLQSVHLPETRIAKIVDIINLVSFSKNGNNIKKEFPISYYFPRYVDRSEAIGIQGLHRTLMYCMERGTGYIISSEDTPKPQTEEDLYAVIQGRDLIYMQSGGKSASVVDHVFDKLMHIKLPEEIQNGYLTELYNNKRKEMMQFVLKHARNGYKDYQNELEEEYKKHVKEWERIV